MPLPEQDILEQGDILAQQRNPGFETEGLPSPAGFDTPAMAPIPIPGTGLTEEGGSNGGQEYLNRFNQSILGTQDKLTPGKLPIYTVSDVYNPRYRSILPGEESEEAFGKAQPWYKQWGNALVKFGANAAGTFANGMMAIPDTISSINGGSPYDTSMGNAIDVWLKNLEDEFPNYYTKWQQDHPFMSAVPFSGGFSNFWGDKFLKNLGFTVGAIGAAVVQDLAVGAVTEGLGAIPLIGTQIGRAALWLNKIFTGTNRATELMQLGRAAGRTGEQLLDLKRLAQAAAATKVTNGTRYAINLYGATAAEAGFEARDAYNTVREDLIKAYQNEKGYSPTGEDLDQIENYARSAGNVRFGANMALIGISNALQFDAILKPFSVAKSGLRSSIEKRITDDASIGLAEGSIDTFARIPTKGLWGKIRPTIPAIVTEGILEEGGQFATQIAVENFYERKYLYDKGLDRSAYSKDETPWDSRDHISSVVHSVVEGLAAEFGTDEGLENVLLGALTGAAFGGVRRFVDREKNAQTLATTLNLLNGYGVTGILQNHYDSAATAQRISEDMKEAVRNNDIFKYKNFQHEQFVNFIVSGAKAGRFDVRMDQLRMLKEMDNEEFKRAFGLDKTTENVKTVGEYVDALIQKAEKIKNSYDLINDTFTNPFNFDSRSTTPEGALENRKHQVFEAWKGDLTFLASIAADVDSRLQSIGSDLRAINPNLDHYHVANFTDKKFLKNYATNLEREAKGLQNLLDQKVSGDPDADNRRIKSLEAKAALINAYLTDPNFSEKRFEGIFRNLLTFHLNGQQDDGNTNIPQESLPKLIQYGKDVQRLRNYRESAYKAFDKLSTEEGFERYFREAYNIDDSYSQKPPPPPAPGATPPTGQPPSGTTPTAPTKVTVKDKAGNTKDFDPNTEYYVNVKAGEDPVKGFVIEQKPDGKIVVQTSDGTSHEVPEDVFFAEDEASKGIKKEVDDNTSKEDIPPASPGTGTKEGPMKKDLSFGLYSTTDPVYSRQDIPFNNFHRRHQNFLFDMGSSDPDVFNQANKPKLRIIPVTAVVARSLGFPKDFISGVEGSLVDNATIRAVYVVDDTVDPVARKRQKDALLRSIQRSSKISQLIKDQFKMDPDTALQQWYQQAISAEGIEEQIGEDVVDKLINYGGQGLFFADAKGHKISRVGEPIDPEEAIFTTFATTELTFEASPGVIEERYTNKENIDGEAAKDWWRSTRASILSMTTAEEAKQRTYQFAVSRGIPHVINQGSRNNPIEVGLIRNKDLDKPIIILPTLGDVAVMGAFNAEGEGIAASKSGIKMPLGTPLLNYGGNLVYLNARKFTSAEAKNIFEILKIIADRKTTVDKGGLFKYLHKVIYMANPEKGIAPTASSITIDGTNLYLGTNTVSVQMIPGALEDAKDRIVQFLEGAYHGIKNSELLRIQKDPKANDLEFAELKAENGTVEVINRWKNYNYYLLSNKTPEGGVRTNEPLAVNLIVPQEGERPIIQKYSEILSFDFDASKFRRPEQVEPVTSPTISSPQVAKEITASDAKQALAKVLADAKVVGLTVQNLLDLREAYIADDNITNEQKSLLAGAVDLLIDHIEKKDKEQGVNEQKIKEEPKEDTERRKAQELFNAPGLYGDIESYKKIKDLFDKPVTIEVAQEIYERFNKGRDKVHLEFINGSHIKSDGDGLFEIYARGADGYKNMFRVSHATKKIDYVGSRNKMSDPLPLGEVTVFRETAMMFAALPIFDEISARYETKTTTHTSESSKEEPVQIIEHKLGGEMGVKRFGFRIINRDSQGNITDIDPIGTINDDGTITPYKNPEAIKQIIMKALAASRIKQDDTNSDKTKSTADKFKGRNFNRGTDRYRRALHPLGDYTKADLDKEFAEVREMIPDFFTFKKLDEMLRTTEGGLAWGALQDNMIYIYKNAEVGTTYHEAFEAVWYHFVTGKEQQDIYNEFVTRKGEFTTFEGQKRKFSEASVKEAKEQLAEEFRDYKMTGKLPAQPKNRSFFQRLLNFIKWLLGLDISDRNKLFKKMNKGYYRNYATSLRGAMTQPEYSYYREPGLGEFSETIVQDMLQGMTAELFGEIFGENSSIIDQLEEDFDLAAAPIYDRLKAKLTYYFEDEAANTGTLFAETGADYEEASTDADKAAIIEQMDSIREIWERVKDNWGAFVREHQRYLRVFGAEFVVDDEGDTTEVIIEQDEETSEKPDYWDDYLRYDAKSNASNRMKLLVASIADSEWVREATRAGMTAADSVRSKRESSIVRLPKLVQYAKLFNYLLHNTSGINGIYDIWTKLTTMTEDVISRKLIDANVRKFMSRLKFDSGFEGKTQADVRMILSAENTLTKQKPAFFRQFTDFQRNTYFKTTVLNSKIEQVKSSWISAIKGSQAVIPSAENRFLFSGAVVGIKDPVQFLNRLGISITQADFKRLRGANITKFNDAVNKIKSLVEKAAKNKTAIPIISSKQIDFDSRLNDLADLYVVHMVGEDTQSQHPNLDNQPTSNFILNNFVSTIINDASNSLDREDFVNRQDNGYFEDIFHKDSILLNKIIFDSSGEKNREVKVGVVEGRETWDGNNKSASNLTDAERLLYEINNNLNGVFYTLLPADAKTEWALDIGKNTYLSLDGFFGDDSSRSNEITAFGRQMYNWLKTEIILAQDYENRKFIDNLTRVPKGESRPVGKSLRFFKDILPKGIVDDIHNRVIDGTSPLEEVLSFEQMRAIMREYAEQKVQDTINELLSWKVIHQRADGDYVLYGFDKTIVNSTIGKESAHTRAELERLLLFREMNYVMNNIEMHKFFFGDPAQYKDELKRIKSFLSGREYTHVDMLETSEGFNQWADAELNKAGETPLSLGDPGYQSFKNHFNTVTAYDVTFESDSIEEIQGAIGEKAASPYTGGNEDDAGAYMTAQAYREMMWKAGGRWTNKQEKQFQWEMAWERNDKAKEGKYTYSSEALRRHDEGLLKQEPDVEVAYPILKLMHSGIQSTEEVAVVSLDKASWAPLFYRWYKGMGLGKLYDAMQKRGIDYVRMESAHKVGIQKPSSLNLYDENGDINSASFAEIEPEYIPIKQIGIQVEQAKKDKGQTEGSQLRKIAIGDLRENGVPIDFSTKYSTPQAAFNAWSNLETEEQKREASPIYTKIKRHNDALVNLTTTRTMLAMRRLGMEEDEEGNITIPDKKMISDFILAELERRELPRNIASAIQISPETRDFSNPIEANPQYTKIRAIIYSILEKTITRPKVHGGQKTMLSVTGMETGPRVIKRTVNGKPVYTSSALKFYKRNDAGTEACEVMLPYWFGKKFMEAGSGRSKEEVVEYLNNTEEGRKLLTGIGFRIPTQGLNSVDFFIVKDFLPEQMGDVIILPSEITVKAGSDFDIDKLNVYLHNYYIDGKSGFPKPLIYQGSEDSTKEHLTKLIQERSIAAGELRKELERFIAEETEGFEEGGLFESIPGIAEQFENETLIRDFLQDKQDNILDLYYLKTLENEYFDSIHDLVSLPENYSRLITPNDASQLKGFRDKMLKLKATSAAPLGEYGKLLSSVFMMQERQAYMASKQVVGISAVSQTAQAIAQNIEGGLLVEDPNIVARFPANTINGKISLSSLRVHGSDQLISNVNSQTTDGGVDVAKDKFLAEQRINKDTLSTFLALVRMGAKPWWAITYLNQPSIQEFLKAKAISDSVSQINPKVKKEADFALLRKVQKKFGFIENKKRKPRPELESIPDTYSIGEMEEMIRTYAKDPNSLSAQQQAMQVMMLHDFSHYDRSRGKYSGYSGLAWDLLHFYQGYNWDTARVNDPNLVRLKALKYEKANTLSITPANKVMTDTFIGAMMEKILQLDEGLRSIINVQSGAASEVLNAIARDVFKMRGTADAKQQLMLTAELSMVDYATQTNALIEGRVLNSMIPALLLSDRATAFYLDALKRNTDIAGDKRLSENPMIKALVPTPDKRKGYPSLVQMLERDYDTYTSNVLTDSFRELRDDNAIIVSISQNLDDDKSVAQIYKRLVLTSIIQGGARSGRGSFSHLIPSETYAEYVRDALRNMRLDGFYDNLVLYRGNWNNSTLVPYASKEITQDELDVDPFAEPYYRFFVNSRVSQELARVMNMEVSSAPLMITQDAANYRSARVIKIEELTRDEVTKQILDRKIRLFRRVDVIGKNGIVPLQYERGRVLFSEINAWGDIGIREYYNGQNQSVLPTNNKVNEATDDQILFALEKVGVKTNATMDAIADVMIKFDQEGDDFDGQQDDGGNPPPDPDSGVPTGGNIVPLEPMPQNHAMRYFMPALENLTGKDTTTIDLIEQGLRTATTRSFPLGKVGDLITFERRPQVYRITQVEQLTPDKFENEDWVKEWSRKEQWTIEHFDKVFGGPTVHEGSWQTTFEKVASAGEDITSSNITFTENPGDYRERTIENIRSSDFTLAIGIDFGTSGEVLTRKQSMAIGRPYEGIHMNRGLSDLTQGDMNTVINRIKRSLFGPGSTRTEYSINIAGNGIYTLKDKFTQAEMDEYVYEVLKRITESDTIPGKVSRVYTGGQTGVDEAGAKAATRLGIPVTINAPKGWKFRDAEGKDISNEQQFKARFPSVPSKVTTSENLPSIQEDLRRAADLYLKDQLEQDPVYYWPVPKEMWSREMTKEEEDRYYTVKGTRITMKNIKDALAQDAAIGDQILNSPNPTKAVVIGINDPYENYIFVDITDSNFTEYAPFVRILDAYRKETDLEVKEAVANLLRKYGLGKYITESGDISGSVDPNQLSLFQVDSFENFKNSLTKKCN